MLLNMEEVKAMLAQSFCETSSLQQRRTKKINTFLAGGLLRDSVKLRINQDTNSLVIVNIFIMVIS